MYLDVVVEHGFVADMADPTCTLHAADSLLVEERLSSAAACVLQYIAVQQFLYTILLIPSHILRTSIHAVRVPIILFAIGWLLANICFNASLEMTTVIYACILSCCASEHTHTHTRMTISCFYKRFITHRAALLPRVKLRRGCSYTTHEEQPEMHVYIPRPCIIMSLHID